MERDAEAEDAMLLYVRMVASRLQTNPDYEPHPLMNALALAASEAGQSGIDGNYMGTAGLGTELAYAVVLGKKGEAMTVQNVTDLNTDKPVSSSAMKGIVDCEVLLDEQPDDVPVDAAVTIMRKALRQPRIVLLRGDDVERALKAAQKKIREGKVHGAPEPALKEILDATTRDWPELTSQARALVGSLWAEDTKMVMVITPLEPTVPKHKIRFTVARATQRP